jgi:hypothetical protein
MGSKRPFLLEGNRMSIYSSIRRIAGQLKSNRNWPSISFIKRGGWLAENLGTPKPLPKLPVHDLIEERAAITDMEGKYPLWEGYKGVKNYPHSTVGSRTSNEVRTQQMAGRFFSWLATARDAKIIVEFGTAFGVSGMFWLAGLKNGHLYTFEPNAIWAEKAKENLSSVSSNFTLTVDTFEDAGPRLLGSKSVDIAFVDAIHTSEFVTQQYEALKPMMRDGSLVLFDDINFSPDMRRCWEEIACDPAIAGSATIGARVGVVEMLTCR